MENTDLLKVDLNPMLYSTTHNHLAQQKNLAKPLQGYIDKDMKKKLKFLECKYFTGFKKFCYARSEPLAVIKKKEQ